MRTLITTALSAGLLLGSTGLASKLTIWVIGDENAVKTMQPAVDLYKQAHVGTDFELRAIPGDQAFTKYLAALASQSGPDLITGYLSYGIELGNKGGLVNIKQKYPALLAQIAKTASPAIMKAITSLDGSLYALPFDQTVQLTYYRKDLVKSAPKNWTELSGAIEKLRSSTAAGSGAKGYISQWGNVGWVGYFPYLYQAGGTLYDAKCSKSAINTQAGVDSLKYYANFYTKFKSPTDGWPDLEQGLENGDYAIGSTGNWSLQSIPISRPKLTGKWAVAKLPAGPSGKATAFAGGSLIGITAYSKNADLAADFLKEMYSTRSTVAMIKAAAKIPALWLPAGRQDLATQVSLPADQKAVLNAQLKDTVGPPNCPGWEQSGDVLQKAIQGVVFNGTDPKAALDSVAETMNTNLVKYK
ncbi:extracellular solute-binding protein [Deinococcus sp.]|uniref:extracellular solute-binding protein n=1 Tax=Deinococcus sp. TaxID=47478 RepID=UPI0025DB6A3C|nr:extracellular solute-binding protein [Deinococcus sp.]